jgi:4-hydroxy-2-oxoheptanedioate aldolase
MNGSELASALRQGDRVYGTCIVSPSPKWPNIIAGTGLDLVFLDTEHMPIQRDQLAWMCTAYAALGIAPIVRIPAPDPYQACMALDGGAAGIVVPYIESVAQVRELRGAVKFRPLKGERMRGAVENGETLEPALAQYLLDWNKGRLMIVNIESVPSMRALDDILAVPDLDAVLIGPHDLSLSLGIPEQYRHPVFQSAVSEIISKTRAKGIGVGLHYSFGIEEEIEWAKEGANLIIHSSDMFLIKDKLIEDLRRFHTALGDKKREGKRPAEQGQEVI